MARGRVSGRGETERSERQMTHEPARHPPPQRNRAVFKIDRVLLLSILAGLGLAVLSSIGTGARQDAATPSGDAATFP
jgi:hypothetical protein